MSTRAEFLNRVRRALGRNETAKPPAAPNVAEEVIRQATATDPNLAARWMRLAQINGMSVEKISRTQIADAAERFLKRHNLQSLLCNFSHAEEPPALRETFRNAGVAIHAWGDPDCRAAAYSCNASLTDCRYALADTGSLLVWCDEKFGRSSTLTTPFHLVILPEERILADMIDGLPRVLADTGGKMPSNIVVINGPSKTADIEMNLVTGVHGPKHLHVMVIEKG